MKSSPHGGTRAAELSALLADAPDPTDHERVRKYVHRLAEAGLSVLLVYPGSKMPADMRTPTKRNADDRAAREAAHAAGRRGWGTVKSPGGLALATTDTAVLDGYLDRYVKTLGDGVAVNLAVEVGGSGLVVVDCDTAGQTRRWFDVAEIDAETDAPAPTVRSPGQLGPDGVTMIHADGGHFWFTVPEGVELPANPPGAMTWPGDDGFAVLWDRRYVLIPPSVRVEGPYTVAGEVHPLPGWLAEAITSYGQRRAERAQHNRDRAGADDSLARRIDAWAEGIAWAEILEPLGWKPAARPDGCGCETWTAPGDHASPKSATTHDTGCGAGLYTETNAPMHIWTDNPGEPFDAWIAARGTATVTKLQAVAAGYYDNDEGAAMDAEGLIDSDRRGLGEEDVEFLNNYGKAAPGGGTPPLPGGEAGPSPSDAERAADAGSDLRAVMRANIDVFDSSAILRHVQRFGDSRRSGPYATLGVVLLYTANAIPPQVVLPPMIGGEVSLNLLLALAGFSGGGKGAADKAGASAVRFSVGGRALARPEMIPLGTGEGINRSYARSRMDKLTGLVTMTWQTNRALFGCRDIVQLEAIASRKGSTLIGELLKAYMGEELGFGNADADRRVILPMNSYRLCASVGVQPDNGAAMVNDQAQRDGYTQRHLYVPIRPGERRPRDTSVIAPVTVDLPDFGADPFDPLTYEPETQPLVPIDVADPIIDVIIDADEAKDADPFGRGGDRLASHRLLTQLKVAAVLAALHGVTKVDQDNWERARVLIDVSASVVSAIAAESGAAQEQEAAREGKLQGQRLAAADEERDAAGARSVRDHITRILGQQTDWTARSLIRNAVPAKLRAHFDTAIGGLIAQGTVEACEVEYRGQTGTKYRMTGR